MQNIVPRISPTPHEVAQHLQAALPCPLKDYCPNGLQIEGRRPIRRIISGVTATVELLEAAQAQDADALLVHHGLFWSGDTPCLVGWRRQRLEAFLNSGISVFAYHLPLDIHPEYGNNAQLAHKLGIKVIETRAEQGLLWFGQFSLPLSEEALAEHLRLCLNHTPLIVGSSQRPVQNVAWCTGGAQRYFETAIEAAPFPLDAYITGEISEQYVHIARSTGVRFIAAGHHATERYGVQALGAHLALHFDLEHHFIDIASPV